VGKAETIRDGIEVSRDIIQSGRALTKLSEWVSAQADPNGKGIQRYREVSAAAGLKDKKKSQHLTDNPHNA
jgi:thymidine phosphorylase